MDEFRISIGAEGLPSSIRFNGRHSIDLDWEGPVEISDRKIRPLLLLALLTEWKRSEGNGQEGNLRRRIESLCPSLKPRNEKAAKSLSQILCDKRNYEAKSTELVGSGNDEDALTEFPDIETKTPADLKQNPASPFVENFMRKSGHWLKDIFGEWPLNKYLIANKTSWDVAFKANVKIVIEEEWGPVLKDDPKKMMQLYLDYARSENEVEIKVDIKLHLESNGECPPTIIETKTCEGSFRTNATFWIKIVTNFETHPHIFWISPDISHIICPPTEFPERLVKYRFGSSFEFRIGESRHFIINPTTGTQTCILLLNGKPIAEAACKDILRIIEECIPSEFRQGPMDKPTLTKHRLGEKTRGLGLQPEVPKVAWQDILARRLKGYGEILYVFSVPHL